MKMALVTGAAGGIGQAVVGELSSHFTVVAHTHAQGDLSDPAIVEALFAASPFQIVVCCAGGHGEPHAASTCGIDELQVELKKNLYTAMLCCREMLKYKPAQGRIVTIGSYSGAFGNKNAAYSIAKAALHEYTRCLASDLCGTGITANCVAPGNTDTPRVKMLYGNEYAPAGRANDIAAVVGFLCSPSAGHINGQVIRVDGGKHTFPL